MRGLLQHNCSCSNHRAVAALKIGFLLPINQIRLVHRHDSVSKTDQNVPLHPALDWPCTVVTSHESMMGNAVTGNTAHADSQAHAHTHMFYVLSTKSISLNTKCDSNIAQYIQMFKTPSEHTNAHTPALDAVVFLL